MSVILEQFKILKKKFRKVQRENRELRKEIDMLRFSMDVEKTLHGCCKPGLEHGR